MYSVSIMIFDVDFWVLLAPELLLKLGATIFQGRLILEEFRHVPLSRVK